MLRKLGTGVGRVRDLDQRRPGAVENLREVVELVVERLARDQETGEGKLVGAGKTEQLGLHIRGERGGRKRSLEFALALVELVAKSLFAAQREILLETAHRQQQDGQARLIDLTDPGFELLNRTAQLALQAVVRIHAEDALGADDVLEARRIEIDSAPQRGDLPDRVAFRRGGREGFELVEQGDFVGDATGQFLRQRLVARLQETGRDLLRLQEAVGKLGQLCPEAHAAVRIALNMCRVVEAAETGEADDGDTANPEHRDLAFEAGTKSFQDKHGERLDPGSDEHLMHSCQSRWLRTSLSKGRLRPVAETTARTRSSRFAGRLSAAN